MYMYTNGLYISVMQQSAQEKERGRSGIIFLFKLTSPIISNLEIGPLKKYLCFKFVAGKNFFWKKGL